MKTIFETKEFSSFWHNSISGTHGHSYKRYTLNPAMDKLLPKLKNKTVLDLGCGNGYRAAHFLKRNPKKVILMDISQHNLNYARQLNPDKRIQLLKQDATMAWKTKSQSVDLIYSDMMLNEVCNIQTPIKEAHRTLRRGGLFLFAVTHPAWDLFEYARHSVGKSSQTFKRPQPYFYRGNTKFLFTVESLRPNQKTKLKNSFELEHFQRPIQDYFEALVSVGFTVRKMIEPAITQKLLKHFPGFKEMASFPISLIFLAQKV